MRNDVTVTSLLFWRTRSSRSAPLRKCCHGNSKGSTLTLLPFNKFLYIFRKSHQIWLNYLSPSLSYGPKTSRVVPNTPPPGRIRLMGLVLTFLGIATKQRLLLGYPCEILRYYCPVRKFSARSELRVHVQNFGGWQAVSLVSKPPSLPPPRYFR